MKITNDEIKPSKDKLNNFTTILKLEIEKNGYALCELADGTYQKIVYREADQEDMYDAAFTDIKHKKYWNLNGESITSHDYNLISFEPSESISLKQASLIQKEIERLEQKIDKILDPIVISAIARNDRSEITNLIEQLPRGFHRSELRTYLNMMVSQEKANNTLG